MAIIVVSHQMGAGGPEIGMSLAQRLGYRYVNQELLLDAARRYGLADPFFYELTVNTEKMKYDAVVAVLEALVRRPDMATSEAGKQMVASRALASRVQVALATHPETRRYRITVEAHGGVVTLEGTAALERAVEVARSVPGVREVKTQQVEIPPIPPFVA